MVYSCPSIANECHSFEETQEMELDSRKKFLVWTHYETCKTCVESKTRLFVNPDLNPNCTNDFHTVKLDTQYDKIIEAIGIKYTSNLNGFYNVGIGPDASKKSISLHANAMLDYKMNLTTLVKESLEPKEL